MGILIADILLLRGVSYAILNHESKGMVLICASCFSEAASVCLWFPHYRVLVLALDTLKDTLILIVQHVG